jgi:ubiquinone/menaquinone biosynthesis C-methylase UbiE
MNKLDSQKYFDNIASQRLTWKRRNSFYHKLLEKYYCFFIPANSRVLEIGCGTGDLLIKVNPSYGVGIDFSQNMIDIAKKQYPNFKFLLEDNESLTIDEKFDYVIMSDLMSSLWDVQKAVSELKKVCNKNTRIIISSYNHIWEPILKLAEFCKLKSKQPVQNWLSISDIQGILALEGFEIVKKERKVLLPKYIPIINFIFNKLLANIPIINRLCLVNFIIARPVTLEKNEYSVSVIVPARNEKGDVHVHRAAPLGLRCTSHASSSWSPDGGRSRVRRRGHGQPSAGGAARAPVARGKASRRQPPPALPCARVPCAMLLRRRRHRRCRPRDRRSTRAAR